jgi:hypothetical protein
VIQTEGVCPGLMAVCRHVASLSWDVLCIGPTFEKGAPKDKIFNFFFFQDDIFVCLPQS